jgi:NAD(P)H-hydrate epimerase
MTAPEPIPIRLTRRQVRQIDQLAVEQLKIPSILLMENAGRGAAEWIHGKWSEGPGSVAIFCGTGNNGGDGFVIARHLHNHGWRVRIYLVGDERRLAADAAVNYEIIRAMEIPVEKLTTEQAILAAGAAPAPEDVVVDALLGTGFSGEVREPVAGAIRAINAASVRGVVAVDVPSGLDCDTGEVANVAVRATATVTFVAAKPGFERGEGAGLVGEVIVVGIGTPPELTATLWAESTE